jgi:uncharacterized cofD-like protein
VVALGGGHGLAVSLQAIAPWADHVTAVVSTADDGGSTGRLRESWDVPALGDVRRCLAALADGNRLWPRVLERRFDAGELSGHAVGNLLLLALTEELGDLQSACDEVAHTCGIDLRQARVVPVTDDAVVLFGRTADGQVVEGQVAVASTPGIDDVWVSPGSTAASNLAIEAIRAADLVVLGPGSLFTSLLATAVVGDVRKALADTAARVVYVSNLQAEECEAQGYDLAAHVAALTRHDVPVDVVLAHTGAELDCPPGLELVTAELADEQGQAHDTTALGSAIARLGR